MEYVASSAEDRKLHDVYHGQHTEGYDMGKDFVRKGRDAKATFDVLDGQDGDVICAVDCTDTPARRKRAQAVLERAQKDLGRREHRRERIMESTRFAEEGLRCRDNQTNGNGERRTKVHGIHVRPRREVCWLPTC